VELSKLKSLVMLNESLKTQEAQFKASCKKQLARLQEELRQAQGQQVRRSFTSYHGHVTTVYDGVCRVRVRRRMRR